MVENLVHSHERDGRSWKGEWLVIPDATLATGKSLALLKTLLKDLQVNKERMLANIRATKGFIHAEAVMLMLAKKLGKQSAHQLILEISQKAPKEGVQFKQALIDHPKISALLTPAEIDSLFDLEQSTGMCADMIDQVIGQCQYS
jgi:adenylosuccinate lyase